RIAACGPATCTSAGRKCPESVRLSPKNTVCEYGESLAAGLTWAKAGAAASARATASRVRAGFIGVLLRWRQVGATCAGEWPASNHGPGRPTSAVGPVGHDLSRAAQAGPPPRWPA